MSFVWWMNVCSVYECMGMQSAALLCVPPSLPQGHATYRLQTSMSTSQSQPQMFASTTVCNARDPVRQWNKACPAPVHRSHYLSGLLSSTSSLTGSFGEYSLHSCSVFTM